MLKWIKLDVYIMSDPKVKVIKKKPNGYMVFFVWIGLIAEAGKVNDEGRIYLDEDLEFTPDQLAVMLDMTADEIRYAVEMLVDLRMVHWDGALVVTKWKEFQGSGVEEYRKNKDKLRKQLERAQLPAPKGPLDDVQTDSKTDRQEKRGYVENMRLKDTEVLKLVERYGHRLIIDYLAKISERKEAEGVKSKSDYLTILNWMRRDGCVEILPPKPKTFKNGHKYTGPYCRHKGCGEK